MNEDALSLLHCLFYEIKDSIASLIFSIKNHLVVLVEPVKGKVSYTNGLPVIHDLFTSTIDDMSYFVRNYEFNVLRS